MATINVATISGVHCSSQSDIVPRKWWPKVATISEVHCIATGILPAPNTSLSSLPVGSKLLYSLLVSRP